MITRLKLNGGVDGLLLKLVIRFKFDHKFFIKEDNFMKKFRIAKWFILIMVVVLSFCAVGVAMADPPVTTTNEFELQDEWIGECDDFTILAAGDHKITERLYYDQGGELTKMQYHYSISNGIVYNSEDPSRYLPEGPDHIRYTVDPESGNLTVSGLALHVTVPGYGRIALNAGRFVLDPDWTILWGAGQDDFYAGELDTLCAYLAAH